MPNEENDDSTEQAEQQTTLDAENRTDRTQINTFTLGKKSGVNASNSVLTVPDSVENNGPKSVPNIDNSKSVLTVPKNDQLKVVTEDSRIRRLEASKPTFWAKDVPAGEKCDCGKAPVTKEILTPKGDMLRRCAECLKNLRLTFPDANWKHGYPETQSFEDKEAGEDG